jgi:hypothetical protein
MASVIRNGDPPQIRSRSLPEFSTTRIATFVTTTLLPSPRILRHAEEANDEHCTEYLDWIHERGVEHYSQRPPDHILKTEQWLSNSWTQNGQSFDLIMIKVELVHANGVDVGLEM